MQGWADWIGFAGFQDYVPDDDQELDDDNEDAGAGE